ncbi:MAG: phosphate acyltransferase, partial [Pseudomonadota bacterium]
MIRIAVDAMGGDIGPSVTIPASLAFLDGHPDAALVVVGQPEAFEAQPLYARLQAHPRCQIVAASEVVTMDDPIEIALRRKKNSSMRVAVNQVKDGVAQAAV